MRGLLPALVVLVGSSLGLTMPAVAKDWHGMKPGTATMKQVVKKFGSADHEDGPTARYAKRIIYNGESVRDAYGATEAQFWFDKAGVLQEIYVIPAVELSRADVDAAFGKNYKEHRTDDFRLYLHYPSAGFVVFFERGADRVYQLVYTAADSGKSQPKQPKAEPKENES